VHPGQVHDNCFSADGKWIAGGGDQTIKIWDTQNGKSMITLTVQTGYIRGVAFSADSSRIVCGNADGSITVWLVGDSLSAVTTMR